MANRRAEPNGSRSSCDQDYRLAPSYVIFAFVTKDRIDVVDALANDADHSGEGTQHEPASEPLR